jgi:hypothetical protein
VEQWAVKEGERSLRGSRLCRHFVSRFVLSIPFSLQAKESGSGKNCISILLIQAKNLLTIAVRWQHHLNLSYSQDEVVS